MKLTIKDSCISCGLCETYCPQVFTIGELKTRVKKIKDYSKYKKEIQFAISDCPVKAIDQE